MTDEETRVHLMVGALAGLAGLSFGDLGSLLGTKPDPEMTKLYEQEDRAEIIARLALQVVVKAQKQL